ncbi:DNA polymerase (family 10) [Halolactibacillus halophilus]|uniref:DNA polymerase (Family 10) n=1 Tax=Halolactibacillus halophilus TaxID=306540 RepID=A0A1I5L2R4_9BACI|nr:DNA polymerase/3'-5' exonuclease PolX [Halolactibacillus halophilus]GEM00626.1 DNA polymerase/3'-5' exonuclease PolX [Halolactibacillus halophilus]SFO91614.1 DNA polymerase (family 10) [Halolactibacillus halophilus]
MTNKEAINKKDIIHLLEEIAIYLELKGENSFKISAYRKAAQALETDTRALSEIDDWSSIKGIGKGTQGVITEFLNSGESETLNVLKQEVPEGLIPLLDIPGLGGKKLAKLYQELKIENEADLQMACENHQVADLKGFGKKSEEKILVGLLKLNVQPDRLPFDAVRGVRHKIETALSSMNGVKRFSIAGSMRRMRETVKDLDFIIATDQPQVVKEHLLQLADIKEVIASGDTKVSVIIQDHYDVSVDFRMIRDDAFATTLHHFTGSKDHNVAMRQLAKTRGEKISEYGVENVKTGEVTTFESEAAFFNHFNLYEIPPEVREAKGEIEAFKQPYPLVTLDEIKGDLHMHTTWSDGAQSIEEMARFARDKGYAYIAITDHSKFLRVANGLNEARLREQREEIERVRQLFPDLTILAGVEMDILPDGSLDFEDDFLQGLDYVIGAIHSSFSQTEEEIMTRLFNAMENPYVKHIAHPTGRIIGKRDGYKVNMEQLIQKAKETHTILELNANPKRFDLNSDWIKVCQDHDVKVTINTDAHSKETLEFMKEGVGVARRGWLKKETVVNTWTLEELQAFWKKKQE